jgi:hypothetical protein
MINAFGKEMTKSLAEIIARVIGKRDNTAISVTSWRLVSDVR